MNDQTCANCRHAAWDYTKRGSLHPSGEGQCKATPVIRLPRAFYVVGFTIRALTGDNIRSGISGGQINRKKPRIDCPCWEKTG